MGDYDIDNYNLNKCGKKCSDCNDLLKSFFNNQLKVCNVCNHIIPTNYKCEHNHTNKEGIYILHIGSKIMLNRLSKSREYPISLEIFSQVNKQIFLIQNKDKESALEVINKILECGKTYDITFEYIKEELIKKGINLIGYEYMLINI